MDEGSNLPAPAEKPQRPTTREGRAKAVKPAVRAKRFQRNAWTRLSGKQFWKGVDEILADPTHPRYEFMLNFLAHRLPHLRALEAAAAQAANPTAPGGAPLGAAPIALPPITYRSEKVTRVFREDGSVLKDFAVSKTVTPAQE